MIKNQVFILSDAKRSGKTTALQKWVEKTPYVSGFLSPDVNGKRMFQEIKTDKLIPLETENGDIIVGKYVFDSSSFKYIENKILGSWEAAKVSTIVLDEIGPLEINKNLGFHNLLLKLQMVSNKKYPDLLLVVRDYCLSDFLEKYNFQNVKVMSLEQFKDSSI